MMKIGIKTIPLSLQKSEKGKAVLFINGKEICNLTRFIVGDDMEIEVCFKADKVEITKAEIGQFK